MKTDCERQRKYRQKMYDAGLKPVQLWVNRKEPKMVKMNIFEFVKRFKKLTLEWDKDKISQILNLFIKITKAKKEEEKIH